MSEQNDLFRLTYVQDTAKDMHWNYRLLSARECSGRNVVALSAGVNGIYLSRANLDVAFNDSSRQINPLTVHLTGNVAGGIKLFNRCGWQAEPEFGASLPHRFTLMARQGMSGKDEEQSPLLGLRCLKTMVTIKAFGFFSQCICSHP